MNMLLIDVGNSRIKWAIQRGKNRGRQRALAQATSGAAAAREMLAAAAGRVAHARIASVRTDIFTAALARQLQRSAGIEADIVRTTPHAAGVTCGYAEPWRLGVDRWMAAIGAHHLYRPPRDVCVVDVGTALTIDLVDRRGRHRGGAIVPSPDAMMHVLLQGTAGIRSRAAATRIAGQELFATNTRAAITQGARHGAAALVERAAEIARRQLRRAPRLLLTGGGAVALAPYLRSRHRIVPDLVLRGLAALG